MTMPLKCRGRVPWKRGARPCRNDAKFGSFCAVHHPERVMARRMKASLRVDAERSARYAEQHNALIGYAVKTRMTPAERAALPEWFRTEYGIVP